MESQKKESFSYTIIFFRICQGLLLVGILIQLIRVIRSMGSFVSLLIYAILFAISIYTDKRINKLIKLEVQKELQDVAFLKDEMFINSPVASTVIEENGCIRWCNTAFNKMCNEKEVIGKGVKSLLPSLNISEIAQESETYSISLGSKVYNVWIKQFTREESEKRKYYILYFVDCTENEKLKEQIENERCIIGYLCIDNIDEITHSIEEVRRPMLLAIIDRKINLWFKEKEVVLARIERDKYIMAFSKRELGAMEKAKFDLLDEMRSIQVGNELPVTVSIGIGYNLTSLTGSKEDARIAFDLAQGRGGDQAIVKNSDKYTFYGGKTKEVEKSARVKVRIKAYAFKELLHECEKVYIMGHKGIDMDCLGAAMGVYRAANMMGKKAQIILNESTFAVQALYDRIVSSNEYTDLFITAEEADREIRKDTLLVIVDTHRKSYLEEPSLLEKAEKVVVFDHHRRSTDYIEDAVLTYLEPFISSTCEMIAEILNYLSDKIKLTPIEADALLAGITIDTKNFVFKAGVRTFEAAALLRRSGADSTRVRALFQNDMATSKARAFAIQNAEVWDQNKVVSVVDGNIQNANIIAAQVADELLNIKGIQASFVLTQVDDCVLISARAASDINVQRIMELLGGGGHLGIAGAQLKDVSVLEAKEQLKEVIEKYLEEGETK